MTTKLTLSVEKQVILKAKRYARQHNKSLSEIVTSYLDFLSRDKDNIQEIDPEVLELSDEIPIEKLSAQGDDKFEYLRDKYLHE
jgi:hypothetical protein